MDISIVHTNLLWPVISTAVVLFLFFCAKEILRKDKKQLVLRIILSLIVISVLALLFLKPRYKSSAPASYLALLTPYYQQQQLDSLKELYPDMELLTYQEGPQLFIENGYAQVFVLGIGVSDYDLDKLNNKPVIFMPGNSYTGIVKLKYNPTIQVGDPVAVSGWYKKESNEQVTIYLKEGDETLDSAIVGERENVFSLQATSKVQGNILYNITTIDSLGNILSDDILPARVEGKKKLRVLVINEFPAFETKYLKNFLAENGHGLLVRNSITTGKYRFGFYNTEAAAIRNLNYNLLSKCDILIADALSLQNFSNNELLALKKAVEEGMGLLIQPTGPFLNSSRKTLWKPFQFIPDGEEENKLANGSTLKKHPFFIAEDIAITPLLKAGNGKIMAATGWHERGKIGVSLLQNTYALQLEGNIETYRSLWSKVINGVARNKNTNRWNTPTVIPLAYVDEPFDFELVTTESNPVLVIENENYPVKQDILLPGHWHSTVWPRPTGWQKITSTADSVNALYYYVSDTPQWQALDAEKKIMDNKAYFEKLTISNAKNSGHTRWQPISLWWFFALFILSAGYLWLEPKLG